MLAVPRSDCNADHFTRLFWLLTPTSFTTAELLSAHNSAFRGVHVVAIESYTPYIPSTRPGRTMTNQSNRADNSTEKTATVYRMVMPKHQCPHGLKTRDLLQRSGFRVIDKKLTDRASTDVFKAEHGVSSTPQVFIEDKRIGGYEDTRQHLGLKVQSNDETTYKPVIAIFSVAALIAMAFSWVVYQNPFTLRSIEWFIAVSMCLLGVQKLQDIERFSTMFLNYDLLAARFVRYGYLYPFAETIAGVLMIAGALTWLSAPVALFIGSIGAISVFKAVYLDKRDIKCACVGGKSRVPLGFVSLTENIMMIAMAVWMLVRYVL